MADFKVAIDAGHGGNDPGAVYANRQEKDDALQLALRVGEILEKNGVDVFYVRSNDIYETPFKKATDANNSGADFFVSIHRNSSEIPGQYSGAQTLVYRDSGVRGTLARNINSELENVGFKNLGVVERPNLVVLKRTSMPAALVEVGFINDKNDNELFDDKFNDIAQGIADGILTTLYQNAAVTSSASIDEEADESIPVIANVQSEAGQWEDEQWDSMGRCPCERLYRVQTGAFRNKENADRMLNALLVEGFPAFIVYDDGIYKVQVGAFNILSNAIKMEARLRRFGYSTYITT